MRPSRWLLAFSLALSVPAQQDAAALTRREQELAVRATAGLHGLADALQAQKQHHRAFELRRELLLEYSPDDAKAREKCGFRQVGDRWAADSTLLVLDKDLTGDKKELRKLDQQLEALGRELGNEHRALAEGWTRLSDLARATPHWHRVLRWAPKDKAALAALQLASFEGYRGDARQMRMLRRARAIRGAVDWLIRTPFEVHVLEGRNHGLLQAIGVAHRGVRSAHFEFWGSLPEADLIDLAQYAERTLLLCDTLFGTATGELFRPARRRDFVFVHSTAAYHAALDRCAAQFDASRLEFLKTAVQQAFVEHDGAIWRLYSAEKGHAVDLDQTVRAVIQDASGIDTDGLWEGIGHAACGFFFNRTLTFLLEQKKERTSASSTTALLSPDLATWRQIAEASAWARSDTRTSELVLLSAAHFENEQRVKAWAISDYLLHWRPEWLLALDKCRSEGVHTPPAIEEQFRLRTEYPLPRIDAEWREFWAKEKDLREAMARDPVGDEKAPARAGLVRARELVDAVDEARRAVWRGPVGFYVADSTDVRDVQRYLADKQKAEARQKKKPKEVVPMPEPPAVLGTTLFLSHRDTAAGAVADWLMHPARRDTLLHPGRSLAGSAVAADHWVLDVAEPVEPTQRGRPWTWPADGQVAVPGSADAALLGGRAAAALQAAGKPTEGPVGTPLSLHFGRAIDAATLAEIRCRVFVGNLPAEGIVVAYGSDGPDAADGCVAFVPFAPLPPGAQVEIEWQLPESLLAPPGPPPPQPAIGQPDVPPVERFAPVRFTVQ